MNRTLLLMAVAAVATSGVKAQSVTYNHDSPKQNPDYGYRKPVRALCPPELYYTLLHNKYKKSAASKNKLRSARCGCEPVQPDRRGGSHRLGTGQAGRNRGTECSHRQIDLAWLAEGDKINAQMERLQRNIDRIPLAGGHNGRQGAVDGILPRLPVRH